MNRNCRFVDSVQSTRGKAFSFLIEATLQMIRGLTLIFLVSFSYSANAAVSGKLSSLVSSGLSPAFDPNVTSYTVPSPANCSVTLSATVPEPNDPNLKLYIQSTPTSSGATVNAWVCGNQPVVSIVIYNVWTEVGRYKITPMSDSMGGGSGGGSGGGTGSNTSEANPTPEPDPTPPALPASTSPVDTLSAGRFLERASFGPTPALISEVESSGFDYWMAQQANLSASTVPDGVDNNKLINRLFLNMYGGPDQLRQRMMFALSQVLVVSSDKNVNGEELIPWVRLLSKHAFGNYRSLLREVALSPTMGKYLDLANSTKATSVTAPNENFPRELMQLFTTGIYLLNPDGSLVLDAQGQPIPAYDQNTVKEVSRALTGWTYPTKPGTAPRTRNNEYFAGLLEPRPISHDTGSKTLLNGFVIPAGQSVTKDLDDVLDNLFQHPNLPPFFATRLIRSMGTSNPAPAYIERVARVFENNGNGVRGDLYAVLSAVLTDPDTVNPSAIDGRLKDPVLHVMSLGRALGAQVTDPALFMYIFGYLGERLLSPPSVFSFYSPLAPLPGNPGLYGPEFQIYSPGQSILRANFIYQILTGQLGAAFAVDLSQFNALGGNPSALVDKVNQVLMRGRMSAELRQAILDATTAAQSTSDRVVGALYLAAISSEFNVQY